MSRFQTIDAIHETMRCRSGVHSIGGEAASGPSTPTRVYPHPHAVKREILISVHRKFTAPRRDLLPKDQRSKHLLRRGNRFRQSSFAKSSRERRATSCETTHARGAIRPPEGPRAAASVSSFLFAWAGVSCLVWKYYPIRYHLAFVRIRQSNI